MFGPFAGIANLPTQVQIDPKDVPPPTPVALPRYQPFAQDDRPVDPAMALTNLLKSVERSSSSLGPVGFSAIGLDLKLEAKPEDLIPDTSYLPNFTEWDGLTIDEARDMNDSTRRRLKTGNLSPGCQLYLERKKELSNLNEDAFRTVRRISPPKGKQQARLGNAYEFFRCLELFTAYWDDPTQHPELPPSPEMSAVEADAPGSTSADGGTPAIDTTPGVTRTAPGSAMPSEFRQNLVSAFIKLVAYDFGCNVSASRVEPRLHLSSPQDNHADRQSYIPSRCQFIFQSPQSRETARAGLIYGPVAAVSSRPITEFSLPDLETAQSLDLAYEVVATLITAQHRRREGKEETRFGEGQWWTSKPRWGGGTGGPIGRETEKDAVQGDKDARPGHGDDVSMPALKKPRKTMSIYDSYRMVRPPAATWDKKARYEAIGQDKNEDYDDIFLVSSLFHHVSIFRVRVPNRLLEVLEGSPEADPSTRSWGKVQAWRSPWFDMFDIGQRVAAMQLIWGMMAYQMRTEPEPKDDDTMTDA